MEKPTDKNVSWSVTVTTVPALQHFIMQKIAQKFAYVRFL